MNKLHQNSVAFMHLATLQFWLSSCSLGQLSPPPSFIPAEIKPGDAAKVKRVIDNIRTNQHGKAPVFTLNTFYSLAPPPINYPANLTIRNRSNCKLGFYFKGPTSREFGVAPGQSETIHLTEGKYEFGIDTKLCTGETPRLYGEDIFTAGRTYTFTIRDADLDKTGEYVLDNDTNAHVNLSIGSTRRSIGTGVTSFRLPEGTHKVTVETRCGTLTKEVEVTQGWRREHKVWCRANRSVDSST